MIPNLKHDHSALPCTQRWSSLTTPGDLMAYNHSIAAMAKKYSWPSWIAYDQALREESAGILGRLWGKEDSSISAKCFNWGPIAPGEGCWICQSLEHQTDR